MASEKHNFSLTGPIHLTSVDWTNQHHRRTVAASLVQGVYILEHDRQQNRHGTPQAQAPPWWNFFHFRLTNVLIDDEDSSIFGAIFKLKSQHHHHASAPTYIIAFRGTLLKQTCISQDLKLDYQIFSNKLHKRPRFLLAMKSVQNTASLAGAGHLWLAGHSLGSAIAMLAGKNMAKMGSYIETYLFNPPFITAPVEKIKQTHLRHGMRITGSVIKAGLVVALKGTTHNDEDFVALCAWKPYLFVNGDDRICCEYIGYFEHRKKMAEIGAEKIGRIATQNSAKSLLLGAMGMESEALHLLPSAYLTVNKCSTPDFLRAHTVNQWWRPDIHCQSELHQFN